MEATLTKINNLIDSNSLIGLQLGQISDKKELMTFLGNEAKKNGISLSHKELANVLKVGAVSHYTKVPDQKVLGPACFNTSADDDEENGGTSCTTSC